VQDRPLPVATEVLKYPLDHGRLLDTGDHPQLPAAALADADVSLDGNLTVARSLSPSPIPVRVLTSPS
jgi:hypothetical protein